MVEFDSKLFERQIKSFTKKVDLFKKKVEKGFNSLKDSCVDRLKEDIDLAYYNYYDYQDYDTSLDDFKNDVIVDEKKNNNNLAIEINIGSNSLVATRDGNLVNAYYFLCFGYGYIGSVNMLPNAYTDEKWQYDVNNHGIEGWYYKSVDGTYKHSSGIVGVDFITSTKNFFEMYGVDIVIQEIEEFLK